MVLKQLKCHANFLRNESSASLKSPGCSKGERCPASGKICSSETEIPCFKVSACATGVILSSLPTTINVGTVMSPRTEQVSSRPASAFNVAVTDEGLVLRIVCLM